MKNLRKNNRGFTLIELIVVMIIIGILVLLATPRFIRYIKDANATSLQVDSKVIHDGTLYQTLRAYDEAGKSREKVYDIKDTWKNIVKEEYSHDIFKESDIKFDESDISFSKWKDAIAATYKEITGDTLEDDDTNIEFASLKPKVLANHIRNTRYGIENFIVISSGIAENETFYMSGIEDGDKILHVSLIPSGVTKEN